MTVCEKRIGELEILIAKIYEDNALGKLSDKRYTMLYVTAFLNILLNKK